MSYAENGTCNRSLQYRLPGAFDLAVSVLLRGSWDLVTRAITIVMMMNIHMTINLNIIVNTFTTMIMTVSSVN